MYFDTFTIEDIVKDNEIYFHLQGETALLDEIRIIITKMRQLKSFEAIKNDLATIKTSLNLAFDALDVLIQKIVNNYEYGESL